MTVLKRKIIDDAKDALEALTWDNSGYYEIGIREGFDITEYVRAIQRLINAADSMTAVGRKRKTPLCET